MEQEKLSSQRHHILELQETVKKLENEVKHLKNRCTNTFTSDQGKGGDVNIHIIKLLLLSILQLLQFNFYA